MIIRQNIKQIDKIDDISAIKEPKRTIIIYTDNPLKQTEQKICLVNQSVQDGSIRMYQSNSELLYAVNCYYGEVISPLLVSPEGKIQINLDALVRISEYNFINKLVNRFKGDEQTANWFDECYGDQHCFYENQKYISVCAPDPRFYNKDHQLLMADSDEDFVMKEDCIYDDISARDGKGVGYILRQLVDSHTTIEVYQFKYDDPYKMLDTDLDLKWMVNEMVCRLAFFAMNCFLKRYTIIMDTELGFNVLNMQRFFNKMDKTNERTEFKRFNHELEYQKDALLASPYNIRLTMAYDNYNCHIQVLPLSRGLFDKTNMSDRALQNNINDMFNQNGLTLDAKII